jgi:RND family efflux transporter MFP subunit
MNTRSWCLGLCAAMMLAACSEGTVQEEAATYPVASPVVTDTAYYDEYVAQLAAQQNIEIRARLEGFIEQIHVDEGQAVREGQLLFTIGSKEYTQEALRAQAAVRSTEAELQAARIELENTGKLKDKNIVSASELAMMRAKLEAAEARVAEAKAAAARAELDLAFTQVKAPFDGVINRIPNKRGSLVEVGALLTSLSNTDEVFAYFNLSEADYLDIVTTTRGDRAEDVSLVLANGMAFPAKGVIETTESEFDATTGNIAFRARFKNPKGVLKHGGTGKVRVRNPLAHAMLVPQKATFEVQGNTYLYVVDGEGIARMRAVRPSHRVEQDFVLTDGIAADERFLLEGVQRVRDGDRITVQAPKAEVAQLKTSRP